MPSMLSIPALALLASTSPAELRAAECPQPAAGRAAVTGIVVDEQTRVPLGGAEVVAAWQAITDPRPSTETVTADAEARFALCDVPAGVRLRLQARWRGLSMQTYQSLGNGTISDVPLGIATPHSTLHGRVVDAATGKPVAAAELRIAHSPLTQVTAADGRFRFARVPPARVVLETAHIGFAPRADSVAVAHMANVEVTVSLVTAAIALRPIEVTTRLMYLDRVGFYQRQERGLGGSYVTREQIERMLPSQASDVLRAQAGITLIPRQGIHGFIALGRGSCAFRYVVDGARPLGDYSIDDLRWDWIEAIEIYRGPSEVPAEFTFHSSAERANCGVIVVWTRRR